MVKRFMLVFQFLDFAARIASGADKLLPQSLQVLLVNFERSLGEVKFVLKTGFGALLGLGDELLQPGNLLLFRLNALLRLLHTGQDGPCCRRHWRCMLCCLMQRRRKSHIDFMIGSNEVDVTGITGAGDRVSLLRRGDWQI